MRKPVSKNALRRAFDKAMDEGQIECSVPVNTVVDRIWHDIEKESYNGGRKKPASRDSVRAAPDPGELEMRDA